MSENEVPTMTMAGVSMSPQKEMADRIRGVSARYKIPMSSLMQRLIEPSMPRIEEIAKEIARERKAKDDEIRQQAVTAQTHKLPNEFRKFQMEVQHNQVVNEARFANIANGMDSISSRMDALLLALGEKVPDVSRETLEPIDSPVWGNNSNK
jgi:hypothetical protein